MSRDTPPPAPSLEVFHTRHEQLAYPAARSISKPNQKTSAPKAFVAAAIVSSDDGNQVFRLTPFAANHLCWASVSQVSNFNPIMKMKSSLAKFLCALSLGGLMLPTLEAGGEILLYPLARAFGSPPESELARCRQAFRGLQSDLGKSRVVVAPVYFVDSPHRSWRPDMAEMICREARTHTGATFEVAAARPKVSTAKLGHNQLRYLWDRASEYSVWVKAARPAGDYICLAEVWGRDGKVGAIHVFVFDSSGQVAYCRLFNSHHFGDNLALAGDDAIRLIVKSLFEDLQREPTRIFPPYGVG